MSMNVFVDSIIALLLACLYFCMLLPYRSSFGFVSVVLCVVRHSSVIFLCAGRGYFSMSILPTPHALAC